MITIADYSIEQHVKLNRLVIYLPQTMTTLQSTAGAISARRIRLTDTELAIILQMAKALYENTGGEQ